MESKSFDFYCIYCFFWGEEAQPSSDQSTLTSPSDHLTHSETAPGVFSLLGIPGVAMLLLPTLRVMPWGFSCFFWGGFRWEKNRNKNSKSSLNMRGKMEKFDPDWRSISANLNIRDIPAS